MRFECADASRRRAATVRNRRMSVAPGSVRWSRTGAARIRTASARNRRTSVLRVSDASVTLRPRTDEDLDVLFRVSSDLDTWEERNPSVPAPMTRAAFDERRARTDEEKTVRFVVAADGVAVGSVNLFGFDDLAHHAEVGIALLPEARGRGIGTAAIARMVEYGFVRCNLRRIHLEAIASNVGALRAYEKAGFVEEGRQREHAWVRGRYEDIVRMGILRSEWSGAAERVRD